MLPEGLLLINDIKRGLNNFRLSTHSFSLSRLSTSDCTSEVPLQIKFHQVFSLPSPYIIKQGQRFIRDTDTFVKDKIGLFVLDEQDNKKFYKSINHCSCSLGISPSVIKKYLILGKPYGKFRFYKNN